MTLKILGIQRLGGLSCSFMDELRFCLCGFFSPILSEVTGGKQCLEIFRLQVLSIDSNRFVLALLKKRFKYIRYWKGRLRSRKRGRMSSCCTHCLNRALHCATFLICHRLQSARKEGKKNWQTLDGIFGTCSCAGEPCMRRFSRGIFPLPLDVSLAVALERRRKIKMG